jgi:hypothetical protein
VAVGGNLHVVWVAAFSGIRNIAADFSNGSCEQIRIAIEMHPTLTDNKYADRSVSVVFGVLDSKVYGISSGFGYTTSLNWEKRPVLTSQSLKITSKEKASDINNVDLHMPQYTGSEYKERQSDSLDSINRTLSAIKTNISSVAVILIIAILVMVFK